MINENSVLFEQGLNYIYPVCENDNESEGYYLLYNPDIYRWIVIDEIGREIFEYIKNNKQILKVKKYLKNKYGISDSIFEQDAIPLLEIFEEKGFLTQNKERADKEKEIFNIDDINKYPFNEMYIGLTDVCNLNCIYCFNKDKRKERTIRGEKDIDFETVVSAMKQFKELGGSGIVFTGGEPTLCSNFIELCKAGSNMGLSIKFITNGTNLSKLNLHRLTEYVTDIGVSLDSIASHEIAELWGNQSSECLENIDKSFRTINSISAEKKVDITIMPIVSKINRNSLEDLIEYINTTLSNCNISWNFTKYDSIKNEIVDLKLDISQKKYEEAVFRCGMKIMNDSFSIEKSDNIDKRTMLNRARLFALSQGGRKLSGKYPKIMSCAPSFFINAKGDVFACQGFEKEDGYLGDIRKDSLKNMFESINFSNVRKKLLMKDDENCGNCELKSACMFKCAAKNNKEDIELNCKRNLVYKMYLQSVIN